MASVPQQLVERLVATRHRHNVPAELRPLAREFGPFVLSVLFPHFARAPQRSEESVRAELTHVAERLSALEKAIGVLMGAPPMNGELVDAFLSRLGEVHETLEADAKAILDGDPAARSYDEVVLTYPGFQALAVFRVAHLLFELGLPLLPRLMTEYAHEKTGIDIHPGATIGRRFCIDHGTGIVIGETTRIGDGVKLYQGVTLGAHTVEKALADRKRHPTIEDEVVIYAGATILGGTTVVGHHSVIAGNAFLTQSVPANSVVTRKSEVRPRVTGAVFEDLDWVI
jgi:serine O-acetyltransferase